MKELGSATAVILLVGFLAFLFFPETLGRTAAKLINGFNAEKASCE